MTSNNPVSLYLIELSNGLKRKALLELLMLTSSAWMVLSYIALYLLSYYWVSVAGLVCAYFVFILLLTTTQYYRKITPKNVLEHLNRQFPEVEESAQLLVVDSEKLPLLLRLQQQKVINQFIHLMSDNTNKKMMFGKYHYKRSLLFTLLILVLSVFFNPLNQLEQYLRQPSIDRLSSKETSTVELNSLQSQQVFIVPPSYTGLSSIESDNMNIKAIVGSKVTWQLSFIRTDLPYSLLFSTGEQIDLIVNKNNATADFTVVNTSLYQIKAGSEVLPQIYTIEMVNDQRPVIRILTPKLTITEISTDAQPIIDTKVLVSDDYGLAKVDILASIAKGSGESVKFRDQVFEFDQVQPQSPAQKNTTFTQVNEYQKKWNLAELNMEPGDELYFTIRAWDNKSPESQLTQSVTKIVRWLEDSDQMVMADGVLINVMPEYFKSQRQIIIETKQLIADSALLTKAEFSKTSELLGAAQSDLKQKYGQYLGDEFDEGSSEKSSQRIPVAQDGDDHSDNDESNHNQQEEGSDDEHQHKSEQTKLGSEGVQSAYQTVLDQYAHNHEDSDVGLMGKQDPVALMKRSVANMWEAELYLMLSKPEQALPYEQQALKFLNMAKKAERIYVKRLGFEPPPVNENRRYQGNLDEIMSSLQTQEIEILVSEYQTLSQAFILLNQNQGFSKNTSQNIGLNTALSTSQRELLTKVKTLFNEQIKTRPALIEFIASIEKMLLANSLIIADCQQCLVKLRNKIWQLIPVPNAIISSSHQSVITRESLTSDYIDKLKDDNAQQTQILKVNTLTPSTSKPNTLRSDSSGGSR